MNRSILLITFFLYALISGAQVDSVYVGRPSSKEISNKKNLKDYDFLENTVWGGNFQLWFGNPSYFYASPSIGYVFFNHLQLGSGMIYNYSNYRTGYATYSQAIFGSHNYARVLLGNSFFLQAQYDKLKQPDFYSTEPNAKRWVTYTIAGIGMRQNVAEKLTLTTTIMHDFSRDKLSIYPDIILQFGITGRFN